MVQIRGVKRNRVKGILFRSSKFEEVDDVLRAGEAQGGTAREGPKEEV